MPTLRQLFGPSQSEIWKQLALETGGTYDAGGFWKGASKISVRHKEWTLTLDTVSEMAGEVPITCTRMRAPYVNPAQFRFTIYRAGLFTPLAKWLGMQDIEIGDAAFDKAYVIQGNDVEKTKRLFSNAALRKLIMDQPAFYLYVRDDEGWFGAEFPKGVDELYFQANGILKDKESLKKLYLVFAEVLNELCRMGDAYEDDPKLKL